MTTATKLVSKTLLTEAVGNQTSHAGDISIKSVAVLFASPCLMKRSDFCKYGVIVQKHFSTRKIESKLGTDYNYPYLISIPFALYSFLVGLWSTLVSKFKTWEPWAARVDFHSWKINYWYWRHVSHQILLHCLQIWNHLNTKIIPKFQTFARFGFWYQSFWKLKRFPGKV